jgi:DNA polymerase zeta
MELFRVRLNCVDHYQSNPTQFDPQLRRNVTASQKQNEPKVPVIRVFGSTETGQKVCAHIHGAFPYLYVEYTGSLEPDDGKLPITIDSFILAHFLFSWFLHPPTSPLY